MKKLKYILLTIGLAGLTLVSCRGEFLDDPKPTTSVSPDVAYTSFEGAQAHLAGMRRRARGQFTANAPDAANLGAMYFSREVKGNITAIHSGQFGFDYENDNREPNYRRTGFQWQFLYLLINQTNAFITGVEESLALSNEEKNILLGQAYTMRAYYYFELSLEYQHTYSYDTSLLTLPIYVESGLTEGLPMSTMQDVYNQITSDLEHAISIGSSERIDKSYFNKNVSYGVAARVYQVMGNWTKAKEYAKLAYGGSTTSALDAASYKLGFDDMDESKEWLLSDPQTNDQSAYYYSAPHEYYTQTEAAYNNAFIMKSFIDLFSETDVRNQFKQHPSYKEKWRQYYTGKFKFSFEADTPLMRTTEMILIEAEAMFKLGDAAGAHDLLYTLQKNRDVNAVKSSNTGDDLYEEILTERKKELYGEMGVEWYDAKRLRRGIIRDEAHRLPMTSNPLKPDDKRFFLKIPQSEIDANPNIPKDINDNR